MATTTTTTTDFEKWIGSCTDKHPPLVELQRLEKSLQVLRDHEIPPNQQNDDKKNDLLALADAPIAALADAPIAVWQGIQVNWFLETFLKTPQVLKWRKFGCPLWFIREVCLPSYMNRLGIASGAFIQHISSIFVAGNDDDSCSTPIVKDASVFLSYTGSCTLEDFAESLKAIAAGNYAWIDIFCVDQFAWIKRKDEEMKIEFTKELSRQVKNIGKTALLLKSWHDVMDTIGNIWVLWEIFTTVVGDAKLSVLLSPTQHEKFVRDSLCAGEKDGFHKIRNALANIDARKATSRNTKDKNRILSLIEQQHGVIKVNSIVAKGLRSWILTTGQLYYNCQKVIPGQKTFLLAHNLSLLLSDMGFVSKALDLSLVAYEGAKEHCEENDPFTLIAMERLANLLMERGDFSSASHLFSELLERQMSIASGSFCDDAVDTKEMIGLLKKEAGDLSGAENILREAVKQKENHLQPWHESTIRSKTKLANILSSRHKYVEAEKLYREVIDAYPATRSMKHPEQLHAQSNLGVLLSKNSGMLNEAELLLLRVHATQEEQNGSAHPDTLITMTNLAAVYMSQGGYDKAEKLYRKALSVQRTTLGNSHIDTLTTLNNLAVLLNEVQRFDEAENIAAQVLQERSQLYTPEHPLTTDSLATLADSIHSQGRVVEAEQLYRDEVSRRSKSQGNLHPDMLRAFSNLGNALHDQGKVTEAESLYRKALLGRKQTFGLDDGDTLGSEKNLANLLSETNRLDEAEQLYLHLISKEKRVMGEDHPSTLASLNNLANLRERQNKFEEAIFLHREVLAKRRAWFKEMHSETLDSMNNLACALMSKDNLSKEAETLFRSCVIGYQEVLGDNHPDLFNALNNLGESLMHQGCLDEANDLLHKAVRGLDQTYGTLHPWTQEAYDNLTACQHCLMMSQAPPSNACTS